jgi:hypothetical protein
MFRESYKFQFKVRLEHQLVLVGRAADEVEAARG